MSRSSPEEETLHMSHVVAMCYAICDVGSLMIRDRNMRSCHAKGWTCLWGFATTHDPDHPKVLSLHQLYL